MTPLKKERKDKTNVEVSLEDITKDETLDENIDESAEFLRLQTLQYSPEEEKKVIQKFDYHIISFMCALYMLSYLDRGNIGNAKTAGMTKDLNITDEQYQWLLTIFYISYIVFQWLTMCWKMFPPKIYVPIVVIGWGIVSSCSAAASGWASLMLIRFLLGIFEAGFGPGVPFYLTFFYFRHEVAWRTGVFISFSPLSSAFAGALAYGVTKKEHAIASWRVLFLIEGLPTILVGVIGFWAIQNEGRSCWFLTEREKDIAASRAIKQSGTVSHDRKVTWKDTLHALIDFKNWCCMLMFFSLNVSFASVPVYLPTIIHQMGFSSVNAQGLSAPPYIVTFFLVLLASWFSDKWRDRSMLIIPFCLVGCLGFLLLAFITLDHIGVRYFACFLICAGIFPCIPLLISWSGNCHSSNSTKGIGFVLLQIGGQCGPVLGTRLFPERDGPRFQKGCLICFAFLAFAACTALVLRLHLRSENKKLDEKYGFAEGNPFDPRDALALEGENNRNFRYIL